MTTKTSKMHPWKTPIGNVKDGESYNPDDIRKRSNIKDTKHVTRSVTKNEPCTKGYAGEFAVAAALTEHGYDVFFPQDHSTKVDLIYRDPENNKSYNVQVKVSRPTGIDGNVTFNSCTNKNQSYKQYGIHYFGVYNPTNRKVFLVPIGSIKSTGSEILRRHDQSKYLIWPIKK